jgi:hypothetical protein
MHMVLMPKYSWKLVASSFHWLTGILMIFFWIA